MADATMAQLLIKQPPKFGGMVGNAQDALKDRAYQLHVQEAKAMGEQPLDYATWKARQ